MKFFLIVALILWIGSHVECKSKEAQITVFTSDDLEEAIETSTDLILLLCNDEKMILCQQAIPQLTHSRPELEEDGIFIGVIDFLEEYGDESNKPEFLAHSKDGMMLYYQDGQLVYNLQFIPPYNSLSIVNWIQRVRPKVLQVIDGEDVDELRSTCGESGTVVVLYDLDENSALSGTVNEICKLFVDSVRCAAVRDVAVMEDVFGSDYRQRAVAYSCPGNVEKDIDISIFENEDLSLIEMREELEKDLFSNFGKMSNLLLGKGIHQYGVTVMVGIGDEEDISMLEDFAKEIDNAQIVWDYGTSMLPGFRAAGATGFVWPTAIAIDKELKPISFNEELPFSLKNLKAFIDGFLDRTYPEFKRSSPIPSYETLKDHEIRELTFNNFEVINENPSVPSLVYYTIEKSTANGYLIAAKELFDSLPSYYDYYERTITLYEFDAIRNFPPDALTAVPQFMLHYKGEVYIYEGAITLRQITQWINELCFPILHEEL